MTQEEKQLLVNDIYGRIPYGVKIATSSYRYGDVSTPKGIVGERCYFNDNPRYDGDCPVEEVKPYLRPMSSMTEEERKELSNYVNPIQRTDFFYSHHIDCRFMIEKGLALEAPKGMYKTE